MRSDMAKLIVERPRLVRSNPPPYPRGWHRLWQRVPLEDQPMREGIAKRWEGNRKHLNENLAPLRRFLESCVGRRWDEVYSEICACLRVTSAVQKHVRDHIADFVIVDALVDGDRVFDATRLHGIWFRTRTPLYVDPASGVLKRVPFKKLMRPRRAVPEFLKLDDSRERRLIDGLWYEVSYRDFPTGKPGLIRDLVIRRDVTRTEAIDVHGRAVYAWRKKQLNTRELRELRSKLAETQPGVG